VTIQGKSAATSIVNGNGIDRVFQVLGGANAVFSKLTIEGGVAQDDGTGGALPGTTVASGGGVLVQDDGHVTFTEVSIQGNQATGGHGRNGTPATGNGAPGLAGEGGGLFLSAGTIGLANSTLSVNTAVGGRGGNGFFARCNFPPPAFSVTCDGHSGNGAAGGTAAGGGLYVLSGSMQLLASSLSGNKADGGNGGGGGGHAADGTFFLCCRSGGSGGAAQGAGLFLASGTLASSQTTVSGNSGTGGRGGIGGFPSIPSSPVASSGAAQGAGNL
jgi:hypothetical protein